MLWGTSFFSFAFLIVSISAHKRARVYGGDYAQIQDYPYQASLRRLGEHFCGGSIITNRHILTAAHCIKDFFVPPFKEVTVSTGTSNSEILGNSHRIFAVNVHPGWTKTHESSFRNDIAVITLADPVTIDNFQQKVNIPNHGVIRGAAANLTGWGTTSVLDEYATPYLQHLTTRIMTHAECQQYIPRYVLYEDQLCALRGYGTGACSGDSGSPLVSNNELVGVLSWVGGGCGVGIPEVYTNVYAYRNFITSAVNQYRFGN